MFGSRLVKYTRNVGFVNPQFRTDLIAFIDNCTKYDLLDGTIDPATFSSSPNIWTLMATPNPARLTPISTGPSTTTIVTCPVAYPILNATALTEVGAIQAKLGEQLNPTLTAAAASAAIGNQITVAYQKNRLATAASTASDIILQNAMINAVNDASSISGQRINDPASLLLAMGRAQAVAQINASWTNYGKVAEEALPLIRNVIEAICYALFPFVILILFLTSGMQTVIGPEVIPADPDVDPVVAARLCGTQLHGEHRGRIEAGGRRRMWGAPRPCRCRRPRRSIRPPSRLKPLSATCASRCRRLPGRRSREWRRSVRRRSPARPASRPR